MSFEEKKVVTVTLTTHEATQLYFLLGLAKKAATEAGIVDPEIYELLKRVGLVINRETPSQYNVRSVDCTQATQANRTFAQNPAKIPDSYAEYNNPLVGDLYAFEPHPEAPKEGQEKAEIEFPKDPFIED